ncbi:(d)CMP kinase [Clostridiaceae bacterium UIB06]|uniref:Cytidylate kinase n=1 Tax=Clostridium thailandense TaxID=2794346 RepID=A0A949TPF3_9CLOT|nr:(d)CMP kinase [Clostridium thailandense]MBV7276564.1 (d)CMP kinase [Clostridium thailandense]MCH5137583.1 (d)CMP kinase [Clostridiaceae bacterium UIB06]
MYISVAIDGPAGAGKSTIANIIADRFKLMYINTGSMYRAVTLMSMRNNINFSNVREVCRLTNSLEMHFENDNLIVNGEDITDEIRSLEVSNNVSNYATIPEVRSILVKLQQNMAYKYNVIMDGRDIGTVVLKDAPLKFFLTARAEERAKRRCKEFEEKGIYVEYNNVLNDIIKRDYIDTHRENNPLCKATDAIEIDSSKLSISEVVDVISNYINEYIKENN